MSRCAEQLQSLEIGGSAAPKTSNSIILPALRVFLGNKKALPHIRTGAPIQSGSIWDAPRTNALLERCLGLQGKRNKERENARSDLDRAMFAVAQLKNWPKLNRIGINEGAEGPSVEQGG
jgi:hypothetical protein